MRPAPFILPPPVLLLCLFISTSCFNPEKTLSTGRRNLTHRSFIYQLPHPVFLLSGKSVSFFLFVLTLSYHYYPPLFYVFHRLSLSLPLSPYLFLVLQATRLCRTIVLVSAHFRRLTLAKESSSRCLSLSYLATHTFLRRLSGVKKKNNSKHTVADMYLKGR